MGKEKWNDSLIVTDTREQAAFWPDSPRVTLHTGDVSVRGFEARIGVERKSVSDLLGSLGGVGGNRRRRFEAAFARLGQIERGAVVIEGGIAEIYKARRFGRITPAHAIGAMISWSARYRVPVYFCSSRTEAKSVCKTYLRLAFEEFQKADKSVSNGQAGGADKLATLSPGPDGMAHDK